jgi:hypothetical protein
MKLVFYGTDTNRNKIRPPSFDADTYNRKVNPLSYCGFVVEAYEQARMPSAKPI